MHTLAAAVVLGCSLLAAPAHAQPETCGVTFVRAPDDIRHEIERWLGAESRCSTSLDLRVIPTADGIYLWAQRPDGRVFERVVPDAQTAGVLVASWAADDWVDASAPVVAPVLAVTPAPTPVAGAPMAVTARGDARRRAKPAHEGGAQWISLGAAKGSSNEDFGYRASADLTSHGPWRFGVAAQYASGASVFHRSPTATAPGEGDRLDGLRDSKLVATVSRAVTGGGWELAGSVGVGVLYSSAQQSTISAMPTEYGSPTDVGRLVPTVEGAVMLSHRIVGGLAFGFGPLVTGIHETFLHDGLSVERSQVQLVWNAALRFAL